MTQRGGEAGATANPGTTSAGADCCLAKSNDVGFGGGRQALNKASVSGTVHSSLLKIPLSITSSLENSLLSNSYYCNPQFLHSITHLQWLSKQGKTIAVSGCVGSTVKAALSPAETDDHLATFARSFLPSSFLLLVSSWRYEKSFPLRIGFN